MKVLITGANGFLGQHLTIFLANHGFSVIATGKGDCRIPNNFTITYHSVNLKNKAAVLQMVELYQPEIIIHTAALSKPDECENDKPACILNNVTATAYLVEAANKIGAKFIYVSTDFIFGEDGPHVEDATPNPLNFYGESKLMAEQLVKASAKNFAIIRPVFIYGQVWDGLRPSFLHWVKNNLDQEKTIKVVTDQQRTPTYVIDICNTLKYISLNNVNDVFNIAGNEIISPYLMALKVAEVLQLNQSLIVPVTADTFIEPVLRAKRSGLIINKAIELINYKPTSFNDGIKLTFGL